jgi:hypothetical protein
VCRAQGAAAPLSQERALHNLARPVTRQDAIVTLEEGERMHIRQAEFVRRASAIVSENLAGIHGRFRMGGVLSLRWSMAGACHS